MRKSNKNTKNSKSSTNSKKQRKYDVEVEVAGKTIKFRSRDLKIKDIDKAVGENSELHSYYNYYLQLAKAEHYSAQDDLEMYSARVARGFRKKLDDDGDECNNTIIKESVDVTLKVESKKRKVRDRQNSMNLLRMIVEAYDARKTTIIQKIQLLRHNKQLGFN